MNAQRVLFVSSAHTTVHSHLTWGLESQTNVPGEPLLLLLAAAHQDTLVVLEDGPLLLIRSLSLRKSQRRL